MNSLNELTTASRSGTLTVAGLASERKSLYAGDYGITDVTVSGTGLTTGSATLYADGGWARSGATLTNGVNTYSATATDHDGRTGADTINVSLPATVNFQYDYNGNLTNDGHRVFEYDFENQLTNVYVASAWRSEFKYDAFGRKRLQKEYTWNSGLGTWNLTNEVRFVYDGMLTVQERDGNNLAMVSYTRGNDLSGTLQGAGGIGGLLARTDMPSTINPQPSASPHAYYHADGNGNVTALVDTNGILVAKYNYDPYGNLLGMSGPLAEANTYRFSSKEYSGNAGLYYYGYRFYEPNLQRWLNRDPIEERGGINLYAFVGNNSIFYVDFFGLEFVVDEKCKAQFEKARKHLEKSALAKEMLDRMDKSETKYKIEHTSGDMTSNRDSNTSKWNPRQALKTGSGTGQSPALGLLHELRHLDKKSDSEQAVVDWENSCASQLGEGTRKSHTDWEQTFEVDDPTTSGPVPPKRKIEIPKGPVLKPN